ncbi:MAG: response regulator [Planctomycetaceae bacterium]|nr:response regulator [Planctomycetaceae bacterium]
MTHFPKSADDVPAPVAPRDTASDVPRRGPPASDGAPDLTDKVSGSEKPDDRGLTNESSLEDLSSDEFFDRDERHHRDHDASPNSTHSFPIVGVGASAGGLESLERLFRSMPVETGMAFVVIQHLSPDFKSLMDELLARYTEIPIFRAEDGMPVRENSIYLIPPRKEMIISGRKLLLTDKDPQQALSMPIDRFFRSLAQDAGRYAIGVILSGSGSDGSRGVRDIHHAGGLVLCESEETAKFDGMPLATMETGDVDGVMAPEEIPQALVKHARQLALLPTHGTGRDPEPAGMETVFRLLNDAYGIDFSHYKPNTVGRRIQRRLSLNKENSLIEYAERLRSEPDELNVLYRDLLIGVTRFFRDVEAYEVLEREVIPELVRKASDEEIRIWVAGCATGEEAYSLAILVHEALEKARKPIKFKIFESDVHRSSLDIASLGVYREEALADVAPERLKRYFDLKTDGYHVISELRKHVVFASHNVIKDAPFTKLDLVSCRNLLIYFRALAQKKAISLFHFGLNTGGVLFLGPSETPADFQEEFDTIDAHWKIFRKSRDVRLPTDIRISQPTNTLLINPTRKLIPAAPVRSMPDPGLMGAYDAVLDRFMPPSLLINERRELLHAFAGAERYLRIRSGRPTGDVLDMLDSDLRTAIVGAVQRVLKDGKSVRYHCIRVSTPDGEERLDVAVEPLANARARHAQVLIVLKPSEPPPCEPEPGEQSESKGFDCHETDGEAEREQRAANEQSHSENRRISRDRIEALELELRYSKENLQATIEELETSNEEMQATNEELVASNEELQSTNEELHSVNEELYTVNAEHQRKITELSEMTADMENLLESTDIGTIFLDRDLNIRKFTPQIGVTFHLLPQDIGRPITGVAHNIVDEPLLECLQKVFETGERIEKEVRDRQGNWLFMRVLPYRTKTRMDGVVLTLIDISLLKAAEQKLSEAVRLRDEFLAMLSHELRNPLGAILNATNVMSMHSHPEESVREACDVVSRQARHLSRLLDDLLDVSRVTQRKIELSRKPIEVGGFVRNAIDSIRPLMESGELDFTEKLASKDPLYVDGDAARLQQALSNLLANSARYTPRGGRVELEVTADERDVIFRVRDTGVGISPDKLETIFELFVQANSTLHRSSGGMGIGLTLARSIVERHDGRIQARSEGPGRGSEFEIRLPRIGRPKNLPREPEKPTPRKKAKGCRVVVVEDDEDNRNMLRMLLEVEGCEVFVAGNGVTGIATIEERKPALALVDIGLPGLNGYDVARRLRSSESNAGTHLVALTGYGQPSDVKKALAAGFDDHLVKPLDTERLRKILRTRASGS